MTRHTPRMGVRLSILVSLLALGACTTAPYDPTDLRQPAPDSRIQGRVSFSPEGCQLNTPRICFIESALRYRVPIADGLVWESKPYDPSDAPDGTTDGASIPSAVWPLVGLPYDPLFVRPAILHDHYTYQENLVRPWQDTHRMFLYALLEEGVDPVTAQIMYYAVYTFGGHWTELLVGEDCGPACTQFAPHPNDVIFYPPALDSPQAAAEIALVARALRSAAENTPQSFLSDTDPTLLARQVEDLAQQRNPNLVPFLGGGVVTLSNDGRSDQIRQDVLSGRAIVLRQVPAQ